jgi:hypothetical protein
MTDTPGDRHGRMAHIGYVTPTNKAYQRKMDQVDAAAAKTWQHPAEDPATEVVDLVVSLGAKERAALLQILRRLIEPCIPDPQHGGGDRRRLVAGYNRMAALIYRVAPETLGNCTEEELAAVLQISSRAVRKHLVHVDRMLSTRASMDASARERRRAAR